MVPRRLMITQMLEQFSHQMGGGRRIISIFPGNKASSHLKLFGSSRPRSSGGKEAVLRMDEFREGGNTPYWGESKEGIIEAVLPKERRIPYVWFLAKTEIYFDSFWGAAGPGREDQPALLKRRGKTFPREILLLLSGISCKEILGLSSKRRQDSQELVQEKTQFFWVLCFSPGYMREWDLEKHKVPRCPGKGLPEWRWRFKRYFTERKSW